MRTLRLVFPLVLTLAGFAACSGSDLVPSDAGPVGGSGGLPGSGGGLPGSGGALPGSGGEGLGGDGLGGDGGVTATGGSDTGSGGASGTSCARVHLLIQRSGAMFQFPMEGNERWWDAIAEALDGQDGLLEEFGGQLDISASIFTKVQDNASCPLETSVSAPIGAGDLADVLADEKSDFEELTDPENPEAKKVDAPVVEAVESATTLLGADENAHIVLIVSGIPDSCETSDTHCTTEGVFTAVQGAYDAGIPTHLLYLSSDNISGYPEGVANAGAGEGIANTNLGCGTDFAYSETPGDASFEAPENAATVKQALSTLLTGIAASCN